MVRYSREPAVQVKYSKSRVEDIRCSYKINFKVISAISKNYQQNI